MVGRSIATVYGRADAAEARRSEGAIVSVELVPTAVWKLAPELIVALDDRLGPPVDSYLNGSQTWLVGDEADTTPGDGVDPAVVLEFRLHPVSGYRLPEGSSHYDIWESVVAQLAEGTDAQALRLGSEVRPLAGLWDGLEAFPAYGDEIEPARLAALATSLLGRAPDRSGLVDHEAIGDAWERANGNVSIIALLVDQLRT
jgi:hypothetical protein